MDMLGLSTNMVSHKIVDLSGIQSSKTKDSKVQAWVKFKDQWIYYQNDGVLNSGIDVVSDLVGQCCRDCKERRKDQNLCCLKRYQQSKTKR